MFEVKMSDIISCNEALNELNRCKFPVNVSLKIIRLNREIKKHHADFEMARKKLFDIYGEIIGGNSMKIKPEFEQIYHEEISKLLNSNCNIEVDKLTIKDLDQIEGGLSPNSLMGLEAFYE